MTPLSGVQRDNGRYKSFTTGNPMTGTALVTTTASVALLALAFRRPHSVAQQLSRRLLARPYSTQVQLVAAEEAVVKPHTQELRQRVERVSEEGEADKSVQRVAKSRITSEEKPVTYPQKDRYWGKSGNAWPPGYQNEHGVAGSYRYRIPCS